MNCWMFPGQPLSRSKHLPVDADWREIATLCRNHTQFDLETWSWNDAVAAENVSLQLYGVAMSLYGGRLLARGNVKPVIMAEHSMGIYPALACCGAIAEETALELAVRVGLVMAEMGRTRRYALGCVVGLTLELLLAVAENHGVYLANHNTDRHFLLSGERGRITAALAEATDAGAFSVKHFPCDAPLHSPLMAECERELREIFSDYHYSSPNIPLMTHIDQELLTADEIEEFMFSELLQPVYWERTYRALRSAGANHFLEVGGGDSLKKYNRWIDSQMSRN